MNSETGCLFATVWPFCPMFSTMYLYESNIVCFIGSITRHLFIPFFFQKVRLGIFELAFSASALEKLFSVLRNIDCVPFVDIQDLDHNYPKNWYFFSIFYLYFLFVFLKSFIYIKERHFSKTVLVSVL